MEKLKVAAASMGVGLALGVLAGKNVDKIEDVLRKEVMPVASESDESQQFMIVRGIKIPLSKE